MNRRLGRFVSPMVLAASLCATQAVYASPFEHTPVTGAVQAKVKLVKFTLRNDSAATLKFKAGDNEMSVAPGKTADMKLPAGTQIICEEAANYTAGSVLATVSDALSGNTLALH